MSLSHKDLFPYFNLPNPPSTKKKIYFEATRLGTQIMTKYPINNFKGKHRVGKNLYLGHMPAYEQHKEIADFVVEQTSDKPSDDQLGLVVSAVQRFEQAGYKAILPSQWNELGVKHRLLPVMDYTADISNECIIATIEEMRACIESGRSVFVHCKAGMSRSAMLCVIYFCIYGDGEDLAPTTDIAKVEAYLNSKRPQVELVPDQRVKANEVINAMLKRKKNQLKEESEGKASLKNSEELFFDINADKYVDIEKPESAQENTKNALIKYLNSDECLNNIIRFSSFNQLAICAYWYADPLTSLYNYKLFSYVKDFFNNIYTSKNWYVDLYKKNSLLRQFADTEMFSMTLYGKTSDTVDKKNREKLCNDFMYELIGHLVLRMGCQQKDIQEIFNIDEHELYQIVEEDKELRKRLNMPDATVVKYDGSSVTQYF